VSQSSAAKNLPVYCLFFEASIYRFMDIFQEIANSSIFSAAKRRTIAMRQVIIIENLYFLFGIKNAFKTLA